MRRLILAVALLLVPSTAHAIEAQVATGPVANGSNWRTDGALSQSLKLGIRFADIASIDAVSRFGYATVDDRTLTYLSLCSTLYGRIGGFARPFINTKSRCLRGVRMPSVRSSASATGSVIAADSERASARTSSCTAVHAPRW